jgi:hypothetical protein
MGVLLLCRAETALAGMPSLTLSDVARMRVQTISFFLGVILLSAWIVRLLWNLLRKDVTRLPALSYKGALGGTLLWGLLFLFVLSMISGARELMTPGAWEKSGFTYQLREDTNPGESDVESSARAVSRASRAERRDKLEDLRAALLLHAATQGGTYPATMDEAPFAASFWLQPGFAAVRYGYRSGLSADGTAQPLVLEQQVYDDETQFVLFTDGSIKPLANGEIASLAVLPPGGKDDENPR